MADLPEDGAAVEAARFLAEERAFRLGGLVTESPHPKTRGLGELAPADMAGAVRLLQGVDRDIPPAARKVFAGAAYRRLVSDLVETLRAGRRVHFTGCGATGRLSILLEAMWRRFWQDHGDPNRQWEDRVISIMAGGDYALIKSVEGFEDFPAFGRAQLRAAGIKPGDMVVAITEGGETPFVIGTAWEGLDAGARVHFVYNNPTALLREQVQRSREIIDEPRVNALDLATGPMALTGSTRMQATTVELLVVGAALETALAHILEAPPPDAGEGADAFARLLDDLEAPANVATLATLAEMEAGLYRKHGRMTYWADAAMLDILTDTTERSPTFMVPPFRPQGDSASPPSWAFVKNPFCPSPQAWSRMLRRGPRGLTWETRDYARLGAPASLQAKPPALDNEAILRFAIGNETDPSRTEASPSAAMLIADHAAEAHALCQRWQELAQPVGAAAVLIVGEAGRAGNEITRHSLACSLPDTRLRLWRHLARKLALNTLSTATMAHLGRVADNCMTWVYPSNKKLIDRGTRIVAQVTGRSYEAACHALHRAMRRVNETAQPGRERPSPVAQAIADFQSDIP